MSSDDPLRFLRARYAADVTAWARQAGLASGRVEEAFAAVPREGFLPPPPWRVFEPGSLGCRTTSDAAALYDDVLVVLDAARGVNNGQPSLHAAWMSEVDPCAGEAVLQVGAGSGYYTAILAHLVGEGGRVHAYEIEPALAALARANLAGLPQVAVHAASALGRPLPVADVVYVTAGSAAPDPHWMRALRGGGRLVMPWQPTAAQGRTLVVRRRADGFDARLRGAVAFVPCVGAGGLAARAAATPSRPIEETRSVWLTTDRTPDCSATVIREDVWFSATEI